MFTQSAAFYDLIYSWKNYRQEVDRLLVIIRARVPEAKTILDVACGTGEHLRYLADFDRTGLDLDPKLLWVARRKLPDVAFILADMRAFDLSRQVTRSIISQRGTTWVYLQKMRCVLHSKR
jgi:ubiquinone/menaquinone biosynthesis C-methylase UbiE